MPDWVTVIVVIASTIGGTGIIFVGIGWIMTKALDDGSFGASS